jgi:hypothetical protein
MTTQLGLLALSSMIGLVACSGTMPPSKAKSSGAGSSVRKQSINPQCGDGDPAWSQANLTNFTSYPDPNSPECIDYNGCQYEGQFAFVSGQQSEDWVASHNIIAVHSKDAGTYALKTLRLCQSGNTIDATVYDECSDSDCDGCCTANSQETGFLIDIEKYTMDRFGSGDGIVDWACLDCDN